MMVWVCDGPGRSRICFVDDDAGKARVVLGTVEVAFEGRDAVAANRLILAGYGIAELDLE